jgi:hypothetical protein
MDADVDFRLYAEPERTIIGIEEEVVPQAPVFPPAAGDIVTNDDGSKCRLIKANGSLFCVPMADAED